MAVKSVIKPELQLLSALQGAQAAAKPLVKSESKTYTKGNGQDGEFDSVPLPVVQAEEKRLTALFGLVLWTDSVSAERIDHNLTIRVRFSLVHVDSGASKVYDFSGFCFPLSEHNNNAAWALEATLKYIWRCAVLRIFDIQVVPNSTPRATVDPVHEAVDRNVASAPARPSGAKVVPQHLPYTGELLLKQLEIWSRYQRELALAGNEKDQAHRLDVTPLPEAWAACRGSAKSAGIRIRPLMPDDKPVTEAEYVELYEFLWAENLRDDLV
jgi:hypothetical protein